MEHQAFDGEYVNNNPLRIDCTLNNDNVLFELIATSTSSPDTALTGVNVNVQTITKMSEREHIIYLCPSDYMQEKCKVFLELIMRKITTMTATPNEIVTKLVEKKLQSGHRMGYPQELYYWQTRVVKIEKMVIVAKMQRGIIDIMK